MIIEIIQIFINIIVPIFILVGIGILLHKKFNLDLYTLAKINIYFLVPALIFVKLYETSLSMNLFMTIFLFMLLFLISLYIISIIISYLFKFNKGMRIAFSNSIIFYNSGNYGVPVNDLVFRQDPFAMSIQVLVLTFQNILTFSYGIFALRSLNGGKLKAVLGYFKMPVLYAMILGILFNYFNFDVPTVIVIPVEYIADALIAMALLTLGAQVAQLRFREKLGSVYVSLFFRLIIGPALALGIILLFQLDGILAQAILISSAMPTSVNSAIIAQEYNNEPEYSAQIVLASTICSTVTVTLVIFFAKFFF